MQSLLLKGVPFVTILAVLFIQGCGFSESNSVSNQLENACRIINGWPEDYAVLWPSAVERHNEAPDEIQAYDIMAEYIDLTVKEFEIRDSTAIDLTEKYKLYWAALELDLINGGGALPDNPSSTKLQGSLMRECDELGYPFTP